MCTDEVQCTYEQFRAPQLKGKEIKSLFQYNAYHGKENVWGTYRGFG